MERVPVSGKIVTDWFARQTATVRVVGSITHTSTTPARKYSSFFAAISGFVSFLLRISTTISGIVSSYPSGDRVTGSDFVRMNAASGPTTRSGFCRRMTPTSPLASPKPRD